MYNPFWTDLSTGVYGSVLPAPVWTGTGHLPSCYSVSDFADACIGVAGAGIARLSGGEACVDRRLASLWFDMTVRAQGWDLPPLWDSVAGNYETADGWIRLHTNAPHHLKAALSVLKCDPTRDAVADVVGLWEKAKLETAIVAANGCAAAMYSVEDWQASNPGRAVAAQPLVIWEDHGPCAAAPLQSLNGVKVLDLTRVLAGPVASRFLAGFGANVLRIDPPFWSEPGVVPEVSLGKRCAGLDLRVQADRVQFEDLLREADVFLHGYRADALEHLGFGQDWRRAHNPGLVDVRLNAYGWDGPWQGRRGFDSLVQMSCGIAAHGKTVTDADKPVPLPVQALDHGTGYLLAAAVLEGLYRRGQGRAASAKLSLARTAQALMAQPCDNVQEGAITLADTDFDAAIEQTSWGPAQRITPPLTIGGTAPQWPIGAGDLRRHPAQWT